MHSSKKKSAVLGNKTSALSRHTRDAIVYQAFRLAQICAAVFCLPVYDERRKASQSISHGFEKAFQRGGINNLKYHAAAVALDSIT